MDKAIHLLRNHEELKDADIICLQEMTLKGIHQCAEQLKYNYVYYPAVFHPLIKQDFGNAILSRWPILNDRKIILPYLDPKKLQRIAVCADIQIGRKRIRIYCVHMKVFLKPLMRGQQMTVVLNSVPDNCQHCVVAGDFNTFTKANKTALLISLQEAGFSPATDHLGWSHKHWTLLNKKNQLDHIFIKGINILKAGKVINRKSSDHLPIWAELAFPKK